MAVSEQEERSLADSPASGYVLIVALAAVWEIVSRSIPGADFLLPEAFFGLRVDEFFAGFREGCHGQRNPFVGKTLP